MASYTSIVSGSPFDLSNGVDDFRYVVVSGDLHLRQNRSSLSFGGVEGTDWDDIEEYTDPGGGEWRVGSRSSNWVIDGTITGTGFSGAENTDWQNIESHKLP